jgi:hemoglobin
MSHSNASTPYERLGGAAGVRRLVDRFYDLMDTQTEAATIRGLHAPDLSKSRQKLYEFLSGWLGGPALYVQRYGHPRMRMRHMQVPIGDAERDQWLFCMERALGECVREPLLLETLRGAFGRMADHLRNQGEYRRPED